MEDAYGRSPLHEAAESGHEDIVDLLIKKGGADLLVRDANDATPYDLAFKNSHQEVTTWCVRTSVYSLLNGRL